MPEQTTTCTGCQHEPHAPETGCEAVVEHGPKDWHRCLCLNQAPADTSCHPLMNCQGGHLGYSDIWHLQRGHSPTGADRVAVLREAYEVAFTEGMRLNAMEAKIGVGPYRGALCVARLLRLLADQAEQAPAEEEAQQGLAASTVVLSDGERQFLTFTLDLAADEMAVGDGFTDEDTAALAKLRRLADEAEGSTS